MGVKRKVGKPEGKSIWMTYVRGYVTVVVKET
jgi:hypothetical protein